MMAVKKEFFLLFANCIIVKGISRSTICDLQKGFYIFIPNKIADILIVLERSTVQEVLKNCEIDKKELDLYIHHLIKHDLGHYCSNPVNFPKISTSLKKPNLIEDCIIELSDSNYNNIDYIIKSLTNLGCKTLELRSYEYFPLDKIAGILSKIQNSKIRSVELYIKYSSDIDFDTFSEFIDSNQIIGLFVIHSCDNIEATKNNSRIFFTKQKIISSNCCGKISKNDFIINIPFYLEGVNYNTCLSGKVSITKNGSIKNCPSLSKSYGNIDENSIDEIVNKTEFKELWNITKNKVNICKHCEFRYICSDCRAYIDNKYDKPLNCSYDPYTMSYSDL